MPPVNANNSAGSAGSRPRVLDVGQCNPDHASILNLLTDRFDVDVDRVMFVDEAMDALSRREYALVLVNRLIFDDGSPGMALVHQMKADPKLKGTPVMLVSNYPEAQAEAVAAGAAEGFGKAQVGTPDTAAKLAKFLPRRA
jgi:two-component system chemotaxis response regulator CheY